MVASRDARDLLGTRVYNDIIKAIDWNRVLLEAQGRHLLHFTPEQSEAIKADDLHPLCGECIRDVLLLEEDWSGIS
jgi:hypothetical protein